MKRQEEYGDFHLTLTTVQRLTHHMTQNLNNVETTKDRQEAAILVFTVFTVIFLPSTFCAQFLAIVPLDFHNIGSMQWLFWVIAVPLTITSVIVVLAWAGELKNVLTSLSNFFFRGRGLLKEKGSSVHTSGRPALPNQQAIPFPVAPAYGHSYAPPPAYHQNPFITPQPQPWTYQRASTGPLY